VASGGFLFVSGQVGSLEDGSPHADPEEQLRLAFARLNSVLAAGACTFADIVDFTVFIVDPEKLMPIFFRVKDDSWGEPPCRHPSSWPGT
jgi:enamine deaminase RidA (YjgF/YER057c/UK114 family)